MLVPLLISCFPPCDLAGPDFREVAFSCGCVVRDVAAAQRLADRPQEDVNVIGEVDALHILSVELETLAPLEGVAPVDLREPGETGPHAMTESLAVVVVGQVLDQKRPWPDDRHVTPDDVEHLGQFVQARGAQGAAELRQAPLVGQQVSVGVALVGHRAKLI